MPEGAEEQEKSSYLDIFRNGYGKWTLFVAAFWTLQVAPMFAIATFIPEIISQFGFGDGNQEYLGSAIINMFYLVGLIPALYLVERIGRRPVLVWPFLICAISVGVLAIFSGGSLPFALVLIMFVIYGIANTGMGIHQWIYPNELFPTSIRATAMGFGSGLFFIGFIISFIMAPETKGMTLKEASSLTKNKGRKDSIGESRYQEVQ